MPLYNKSAEGINYDNVLSGLPGENVQDAIDNLASGDFGPKINQVSRKITVLMDSKLKISDDFGQMRINAPKTASDVQGMIINKSITVNSDASLSINSTAQVQVLGV